MGIYTGKKKERGHLTGLLNYQKKDGDRSLLPSKQQDKRKHVPVVPVEVYFGYWEKFAQQRIQAAQGSGGITISGTVGVAFRDMV